MFKLNVGCGKNYLSGYVNIDFQEPLVADKLMPAWDLAFPEESCSEIIAKQLIEHLGFFKARYFLSECYRVLAPGGKILIETPDVETSFRLFLSADRPQQERLAQWIFGLETAGMHHIFCFPKELLFEEAENAGFIVSSAENFMGSKDNPSLRISLEKQSSDQTQMLISKYKKILLKERIAHIDNELLAGEEEKLARFFKSRLQEFNKQPANDAPLRDCLLSEVNMPQHTEAFFKIIYESGLPGTANICKAADTVSNIPLAEMAWSLLIDEPIDPGTQSRAYDKAEGVCRAIITRVISGETALEALKDAPLPIQDTQECGTEIAELEDFTREACFTPAVAMQASFNALNKGDKALSNKEYSTAMKLFEISSRIYRDNPITYWHLATAKALEGNPQHAAEYYNQAVKAAEESQLANRNEIVSRILKEADEICLIEDNPAQ